MDVIDLSLPCTQERFGGLVGVSQQAIGQLIADGHLEREAPAGAWLRAYCGRLREQAAGRVGRGTVDLAGQRAILAQRQVEVADLRLARLRGELVSAAAVHRVLAGWATNCRDRVLNVSPRLAPLLAHAESPHEVAELLDSEMHDLLRHISTAVPAVDGAVADEVAELRVGGAR